jgi:phosphatidylglycerophosphate synthase
MLSDKKPTVEKYLDPVVEHFKEINPNVLTLLGSIPPLLFFVFVLLHWYVLALVAFVGNLFDFIDGMVARKYNKVTAFGGFLDSTLDRVGDFFLITAFAFAGIVRWEIVAPLLLFSFLISYARGTSEKVALLKNDRTTKFNVGIIERSERLVLILAALLAYMAFPTIHAGTYNIAEIIFGVLMLLSCYTAYQRIMYAYKKL